MVSCRAWTPWRASHSVSDAAPGLVSIQRDDADGQCVSGHKVPVLCIRAVSHCLGFLLISVYAVKPRQRPEIYLA